MVTGTWRCSTERSGWSLLALAQGASRAQGSSCQEKWYMAQWRVSASSAMGTSHAFNYFSYPGQKADQWCKRKHCTQTLNLETPSHVTVSALLALRLGGKLGEYRVCWCLLTGLEKWLWTCQSVSVFLSASWKSPRWPSFCTYIKVTSIHKQNNKWQAGKDFLWKGPKT